MKASGVKLKESAAT